MRKTTWTLALLLACASAEVTAQEISCKQFFMKTLIVDDTRLARQEMKTLLARHADIELVGEAEDLPAAAEAVARLSPRYFQLVAIAQLELVAIIDPGVDAGDMSSCAFRPLG